MCGVFGVWNHDEAANIAYLGLQGLQHRGQESAGIVSSDAECLYSYRRMGRVADVFDQKALELLPGRSAVGHVRYSTTGQSVIKNAQPFAVDFDGSSLAIAHNGNLTNATQLRRECEARGSIFHTSMDTEIIVHLMARARGDVIARLREAMAQIEGAYSLVVLTPDRLIAARDPHGFRPLVLGTLGDASVVSSESCALRLVDAQLVREVQPGEILEVDGEGARSHLGFPDGSSATPKHCIFEHIYFSRPDSVVFGHSVYDVRKDIGRRLADECPVPDADVVIPVPDSGIAAAIGYAQRAQIPYEMGLIRSHYAGRTFIEPTSSIRHFGVKLKLSPVDRVIAGKRVVVVDDSLVRGTTSRKIVHMLKEAGAGEVHMRISCPPTIASCYYGIDTPDPAELIASSKEPAEIARFIGADRLAYLSLEGLHSSVANGDGRFCDACFTRKYPVACSDAGPSTVRLAERG